MKNVVLTCCTILCISIGCKQKDKEEVTFFPVLDFLQGQVADIDSSVYPLMKIVTVNNTSDTSFIKKDEFKTYARQFTTLPDISSEQLKEEYTATEMFDETIGRVVLNYTPKNTAAEIRRQEVQIAPDQAGDKVKAIIIDRLTSKGDSTVQQRMFWQVDKRFQIVTIVQKIKQPDKITTTQIIWNDFPATQ